MKIVDVKKIRGDKDLSRFLSLLASIIYMVIVKIGNPHSQILWRNAYNIVKIMSIVNITEHVELVLDGTNFVRLKGN